MDVFKKLKLLGKSSDVGRNQNRGIYQFSKNSGHVFIPSALAFDHEHSLLALGTESGAFSIYGRPGVQLYSDDSETRASVKWLSFLPGQDRLVALFADNSVGLWTLSYKCGCRDRHSDTPHDPSHLWDNVLSMGRPGQVTTSLGIGEQTVTSCCLSSSGVMQLILGTSSGSVLTFDIDGLQLSEEVLTRDKLLQSAPESVKANDAVAIVSLVAHPTKAGLFIVGFKGGYIVLCKVADGKIEQSYNTATPLESIGFAKNGEEFTVAHSDGSYSIWRTSDSSGPVENATTPYGPFPCEPIKKMDWQVADRKSLMVFTGGMPTANYKDRHTVSIIEGEKHFVLDLSSKVIDYVVLRTADEDKPDALFILAEKEVVVIDLKSEDWQECRLPYLRAVNGSAIQTLHLEENVPATLWEQIASAGDPAGDFSARDWPITGGRAESDGRKDLLLTGHADGSLSFWDAYSPGPNLLYKVRPDALFGSGSTSVRNEEDQGTSSVDWPPFRKVGSYEETTGDDSRIGIHKIALCVSSGTLALGSNSGQIIVLKLNEVPIQASDSNTVTTVVVDIVKAEDQYEWCGMEPVPTRAEAIKTADKVFRPVFSAQLNPPTACTSLSLHSEWKLLAVASSFGYALIDYFRSSTVISKCTLVPPGGACPGVVRTRSLKTSLRESFRNLRVRPRVSRSFDVPHNGDDQKTQKPPKSESEPGASGEVVVQADEVETKAERLTSVDETGEVDGTKTAVEENSESPSVVAIATKSEVVVSQEQAIVTEVAATSEEPASIPAETIIEKPVIVSITISGEGDPTQSDTPGDKVDQVLHTSLAEKGGAADERADNAEARQSEADLSLSPQVSRPESVSSPEVKTTPSVFQNPEERIRPVHCVYLAETFLGRISQTPTMWVGDCAGHVSIYQLTIPSEEKRADGDSIDCIIAKEINIRHGAPVVSITVVDRTLHPLKATSVVSDEDQPLSPGLTGGHRVVICTQEQLKIFSLPSLKAQHKFKLARTDNCPKVCSVEIVSCSSMNVKGGARSSESAAVCLTSDGVAHIISIPQLKLRHVTSIMDSGDLDRIGSCVISPRGTGFLLHSSSQFDWFSLAAMLPRPTCTVSASRSELRAASSVDVPQEATVKLDDVTAAATSTAELEVSTVIKVADQTELDIITETTAVVSEPVADQSVQDNSAAAADQSVNEVAADTSTANKSAAEASQNGISVLSAIDDSALQAAVDTSCDSVHEVIVHESSSSFNRTEQSVTRSVVKTTTISTTVNGEGTEMSTTEEESSSQSSTTTAGQAETTGFKEIKVGLHELGIGLTDLKTGEFESVTSSIEGDHTTTVIETNGDWKQTSSSGVVTTDLKTEPWDVAERHSETKTVVVTSMAE